MRFWNNGKGESNVLQNQFTRYLKTAVQRKKMDILRERKKSMAMSATTALGMRALVW